MRRVPRRLRAPAGLLLVLASVLGLAACGAEGTGAKGYVTGKSTIVEVAAADRERVGTISGETLEGETLRLSSYAAGRPVVLNSWGSWCAPCREEAPTLVDAQRSLGDRVAFLGVNIRESGGQDRAQAFERRFSVPYPSLYDPAGRSLLEIPGRRASLSIPSTVVIDSQGRLAATVIGPVPTPRTLVDLVEDAG